MTTDFNKEYIDKLLKNTFIYKIRQIEKEYHLTAIKQYVNQKNDDKSDKETCMICLDKTDIEPIVFKCKYCSCYIHQNCLTNYIKTYTVTECMQCKQMNSYAFNNCDF